MPKKCIICNKDAEYCIKNSSECYCKDCAEENFSDISCLTKMSEEDKKLIEDKMDVSEGSC
jgi:hypothetical protein